MRFITFLVIFLLFSESPLISLANTEDSYLQQLCDKFEWTPTHCSVPDKVLQFLGYGGLAAAVGTYGVPFVFAKLGFFVTGIQGGSFAAWWQSMGWAPSIFSYFQSASMTGAAADFLTKMGIFGASVKGFL